MRIGGPGRGLEGDESERFELNSPRRNTKLRAWRLFKMRLDTEL